MLDSRSGHFTKGKGILLFASFMRLGIKAVPGASKNAVVGWLGEDLKIRITAPACDGKANEALCAFLATWLGIARRDVSIFSGASSRRKIVEIEGVDRETLCSRIEWG